MVKRCEQKYATIQMFKESGWFHAIDYALIAQLPKVIPDDHDVKLDINYLCDELDKRQPPELPTGRMLWFHVIQHLGISEEDTQIIKIFEEKQCMSSWCRYS